MRQNLKLKSYITHKKEIVKFDHTITFSILILIIIVFSFVQISAQEEKKNKIEEKTNSDKLNLPSAIGDAVVLKDENSNLLFRFVDEGSFGSFQMSSGIPSNTYFKLYNSNGTLYFNGSELGNGAASDINSLSDAKFDGSSLFIGLNSGTIDDGTDNLNTAIGLETLPLNENGSYNSVVGYRALYSNVNGYYNSVLGFDALSNNTSGWHNVAIGAFPLDHNARGMNNIAIGFHALGMNVSGNNGIAIGYESQRYANNINSIFDNKNTSVGFQSLRGSLNANDNRGIDNTALGYQTLFSNMEGSYNTSIGNQSLFSNTNGDDNVALGNQALYTNTTGNNNIAVGNSALFSNTTGSNNTAIGFAVLEQNINGSNNTGLGWGVLSSNLFGYGNTGVGQGTLNANTSGFSNTSIGYFSSVSNTIGTENVCIGSLVNANNLEGSRNTIIGAYAGRGSFQHSKSGNVFIGYQAGQNEIGNNKLYINNDSSDTPLIWGNFSTHRIVINGNNTNGNIQHNFYVNGEAGGNTAWNNLSDERLKKNISTISNALEKVKKLRGVNYEWRDSEKYSKNLQMGFIAQEANKVIPEVVDDSGEYFSMQYAPITALLVEAIKELENQIENLSKLNSELRAQNLTIINENINLSNEVIQIKNTLNIIIERNSEVKLTLK